MRRWLNRILIVLAVFVLPPVAFYFYSVWQGERELRAAIEELDAAGEPWRWEDLMAARPALADEDDVRELIDSVCRQAESGFTKVLNHTSSLDLPPNFLMSEHDVEIFREAIAPVDAPLAEARKLADMPRSRIPLLPSFADSSGAFDRNFQNVRVLASRLQCAAAWHAYHGDLDTATVDCLAMIRASHALQDELTLMPHLLRGVIQSIAHWNLQRVLAHGQPWPARLRQFQEVLEHFNSQRAILNAYRGERASVGPVYDSLSERKTIFFASGAVSRKALPFEDSLTDLYYRANLKQAQAWTQRHLTAALAAMEMSEPERSARWRELEREERNAPVVARLQLQELPYKTFRAHQRTEATARCAIAGLAAERFRQDQDRWPHTLAELSPKYLAKVADDPCTGKPLQLRVTNDGIVIYSVGPDGQFSGNYQELVAAKQVVASYEFRLWNVSQRRQIVAAKP